MRQVATLAIALFLSKEQYGTLAFFLKIMSISDKELKQIAYLARIGIEQDDFQSLRGKLSDILNMVNELNKIDTENVSPMSHPLDISQPLREDEVTEKNQRESLQEGSPHTKAGLFLVPKVIDKEE